MLSVYCQKWAKLRSHYILTKHINTNKLPLLPVLHPPVQANCLAATRQQAILSWTTIRDCVCSIATTPGVTDPPDIHHHYHHPLSLTNKTVSVCFLKCPPVCTVIRSQVSSELSRPHQTKPVILTSGQWGRSHLPMYWVTPLSQAAQKPAWCHTWCWALSFCVCQLS